MSITNTTQIDAQLEDYAIVEGYMGFPLYTFTDEGPTPEWDDDLGYTVCPKVNDISWMRGNNDKYYADLVPLKDVMAPLFAKEFDVSEAMVKNLTVHDMAGYADVVFSEYFEGVKQKIDWK